jgi:hypothetical protein
MQFTDSADRGTYVHDRGDGYPEFREQIARRTKTAEWPLFTTDTQPEELQRLFLDGLPYGRHYYNCRACLKFLGRYGGLVNIDDEGTAHPLLWDTLPSPYFVGAVKDLWKYVIKARVTGVFVAKEKVWGTPETPPWTHLYGEVSERFRYDTRPGEADKRMAQYREDFRILCEAIAENTPGTFRTLVRVLGHEEVYRGEKFINHAQWLLDLLEGNATNRRNKWWKAVATAPAGWCHVKSSVLGTVLEDIQNGLSFNVIAKRFKQKMHPLRYQRPQVVKEGNIDEAEKLIASLGLQKALERRFAIAQDLRPFWSERGPTKTVGAAPDRLFDSLRVRAAKKRTLGLPQQTMTWVKFYGNVLPQALGLELEILQENRAYFGFVAPVYKDAPPLLQWPNGISWYLYDRGSRPGDWNLHVGWARVPGLTGHPAYWGDQVHPGKDGMLFLLLEGAKDLRYPGKGGLFFPSMLRNDLRPIRSTLEAYSKSHGIGTLRYGPPSAGLMVEAGNFQPFTLRVNGQDTYKIDRWD